MVIRMVARLMNSRAIIAQVVSAPRLSFPGFLPINGRFWPNRHFSCSQNACKWASDAKSGFETAFSAWNQAVMRKKVLLVDDDLELLAMLRLSFKGAGFSVTTARDGMDALEKARTLRPDVILLDLVLPGKDGFAVCESLRRNSATASIPIIVVTGLSSELSRLAGMESGATDYVTKPVSPETLVAKMRHYLTQEHPVRPAPAGTSRGPIRSVACVE